MKQYSIFSVEEWRKKYLDRTETHLKSWGFNYGADPIHGEVILSTPDDQVPERNQLFLVTVEPIDGESLKLVGNDTYEVMTKFFKERREKDAQANSGMKIGRKFR